MMALVAAFGAVILLLLAMMRLFVGPTLYDRALAAKTVLVRLALVCAALAVAAGAPMWVDVALAISFGALALLTAAAKVFRARTFQPPLAREEA